MWCLWTDFTGLVSKPILTESNLQEAQAFLVKFADEFTALFGAEKWKPNLHFVFHLCDDIRNFGPVYAFWTFATERFNGVMQGYHTDGRCPETTMMRQIRHFQRLAMLPDTADLDFSAAELKTWLTVSRTKATSEAECDIDEDDLIEWSDISSALRPGEGHELKTASCISEVKGSKREQGLHRFDSDENRELKSLVTAFIAALEPSKFKTTFLRLPSTFRKFKRVQFCGETFCSSLWRQGKDADVLVRKPSASRYTSLCPAFVQFYIQVDMIVSHPHALQLETRCCRFAACQWYTSQQTASRLVDTVWQRACVQDEVHLEIVPIAMIASAFLKGPCMEEAKNFQILIKPTQLILWHPDREAVQVCFKLSSI